MAKDESIRGQMFTNIISWQSSKLSQKEWCRQQGITYHVFHYWYRKYRELHSESTDTSSFVRLSVKPADNASCEVIFVDGTWIVFREPVPVHYLKAYILAVLHLSSSCRYYLYLPAVHMRKSFDGLAGIVQNELKANPLSAAVFIFLNRRNTIGRRGNRI